MYHMIDYIREEPAVLERTFIESADALGELVAGIRRGRWTRLVIAGIGSSHTASLMAQPAFRLHCPIPTEVLPSTELDFYRERWLGPDCVVVSVSRSGERGRVVEVQQDARARGAFTVALTGVPDSLLATTADMLLPTAEGAEITFSKTKSVVTCAGLLTRLALCLSDGDEAARRLAALDRLPALLDATIQRSEAQVVEIVSQLGGIEQVFLCGSGANVGAALEGAIKIQETSFVPAKAEDTGDALHGVLGTLDARWLMIALAGTTDATLTRALLRLAGASDARRLAITEPGLIGPDQAEHRIETAEAVDPILTGLLALPPLQLLTFYLTLARGRNPDAPTYMRAQLDAMLPPGREEPELRASSPVAGRLTPG